MDLEDYGQPANFLASQVWPSARVAAIAMEQQLSAKALSSMTVCEFGCGPGLPSLTAAKLGAQNVVATDLDPLALELVQKASEEQGFQHVLQTQRFDLTGDVLDDNKNRLPEADLYLLSDVFESKQVALGAARVTCQILHKSQNARIWVFAQSDRACREDYLEAMRKQHQDKEGSRLEWLPMDQHDIRQQSTSKLLLFDLDETTVAYG
ncbi:expressed unknown protein [Seminavis robusta]|uniref:Methyltransferase domain-containing protein n=1 Tax=Seminavis robusta TaxID=568900 RepID=A0A9N8D8U8_9STRA|nr:expressed unknown protein [Seminavis robusta]|eukprot:Sro3_g002820.1 n/a (208) ;mRNA; r:250921-251544